MEVNIYALRKRDPGSPVLERFTEIATLLTKNALAKAEDGTCWLKKIGAKPEHLSSRDLWSNEIALPQYYCSSQKGQ
jgi:hypothetical protein